MTNRAPALPRTYDPTPWAAHTEFSDPGRHRDKLLQVSTDLEEISEVSRNLVGHYLAAGRDREVTAETAEQIDSRWVTRILDWDRTLNGRKPLSEPRDPATQTKGCCRDHSLLAVSILRSHGIPARVRYGYANYLVRGFSVDHTIVEVWDEDGRRWRRFDPEIMTPTGPLQEPLDQPVGEGAPFRTAAEVWQGWRAGALDPNSYGVRPGGPERGPWFIQSSVIRDAAFRARQEPLLWDVWGDVSNSGGPTDDQVALADRIAAMTVAADQGDVREEARLLALFSRDERVRLQRVVRTLTPGRGATTTDLRQR